METLTQIEWAIINLMEENVKATKIANERNDNEMFKKLIHDHFKLTEAISALNEIV